MIYDYLQNVQHVHVRMVTCGFVVMTVFIKKTRPTILAIRQSFILTRFVAVLNVGVIWYNN